MAASARDGNNKVRRRPSLRTECWQKAELRQW